MSAPLPPHTHSHTFFPGLLLSSCCPPMLRLFLLPSLAPHCHHAALAVTFRNQSSFCPNRVEPKRKAQVQVFYLGSQRSRQRLQVLSEGWFYLHLKEQSESLCLLSTQVGLYPPAPTGWPCSESPNFAVFLGCTWVEADGFCSSGGGFGRKLQGRASAVYMSSQGNIPWNFSSYKCCITKPLPSPPCGPHDVYHMKRHLGAF